MRYLALLSLLISPTSFAASQVWKIAKDGKSFYILATPAMPGLTVDQLPTETKKS